MNFPNSGPLIAALLAVRRPVTQRIPVGSDESRRRAKA
jgi:hypothetical protein